MNEQEPKDYPLKIRSLGITTGEVFVLGECVRMWGIVGTVKMIRQTPEGFVIDVWRRTTTLSEPEENEVTIVQIPPPSILWVAAGHLKVDNEGNIIDEEE